MRPALAAVLVVPLALAAGCASAPTDAKLTDSEQKVANVVNDFEKAAGKDDATKACRDYLSAAAAQRLGGADCAKTLQQAFDQADALSFDVQGVRITGSTARVRVTSGSNKNQTDQFSMVRVGNAWRIDDVKPIATKKPNS